MKLPELKKHFKNKYAIRIMAGVLVVALVGTGMSAYTVSAANSGTAAEDINAAGTEDEADAGEEKEGGSLFSEMSGSILKAGEREVGKEETVYVISDSSGAVKSIIVSDHLLNRDGASTIEDASTLAGITNVKGDETYTQNGKKLTWAADGNDIYYQGTSTEQLPVTQKITYALDGKEIAPEELAGKSGRVTIRFVYTNNEKKEVTIGGRKEEICVPFAAISGMVLDDSFRNIEVTNGKVMADGNNSIVVGYALPGLSDSLNVDADDFDGDVNIPEYFEVTADVDNFSLDMAVTLVANATSFLETEDGGDGLDSVKNMLDTLADASGQLEEGSAELAEGTDTLKDGMGEFQNGVNTLKDGVTAYTDGASQVADGIAQLSGKTPELSAGVAALGSSAATLYQGVSLLDNTLNAAFTDQEKENLTRQVNNTIAGQEDVIKNQARSVVSGQAEAIKSQAQAAVDAQADMIRAQAKQTVDAAFSGGQYAAIQGQASEQVKAALTGESSVRGVADGIRATDAYYYMVQGIRAAALQEVIAQSGGTVTTLDDAAAAFQMANGVSVDDFAVAQAGAAADQLAAGIMTQVADTAAPQMGTSVADTALFIAQTTAGDAAVLGAKAAAGDAAVLGATEAAGTAAYEGAKAAAGTAAVSAAEQTKRTIANNIEAVSDNGYSLVTGMQALSEGAQSLQGAMPALLSGVDQLSNGSRTLVENNGALRDGVQKLSEGAGDISDGVEKLSDGAHQLADGIVEFNEKGIEEILNAYNGDIEPLAERLQAVLDAGAEYQTYTELADQVDGSVRFVYKTAAIKEK